MNPHSDISFYMQCEEFVWFRSAWIYRDCFTESVIMEHLLEETLGVKNE